jgi:hypothetical protein
MKDSLTVQFFSKGLECVVKVDFLTVKSGTEFPKHGPPHGFEIHPIGALDAGYLIVRSSHVHKEIEQGVNERGFAYAALAIEDRVFATLQYSPYNPVYLHLATGK